MDLRRGCIDLVCDWNHVVINLWLLNVLTLWNDLGIVSIEMCCNGMFLWYANDCYGTSHVIEIVWFGSEKLTLMFYGCTKVIRLRYATPCVWQGNLVMK